MRTLGLVFLVSLAGCSVLAGRPTESILVEMCRDNPAAAKTLADTALKNGWTYAGPVYNNGLNCTDTLWVR
jgi:hypothetical protein